MKWRGPFAALSLFAVIASLYFILTKGLNYGVDFAGGVQMVLQFPSDSEVNVESLRKELSAFDLKALSVQRFGDEGASKDFIIHFSGEFADEAKILAGLEKTWGSSEIEEFRISGLERAFIRFSEATNLSDVLDQIRSADWGLFEIVEVKAFGREGSREFEIVFAGLSSQLIGSLNEKFGSSEAEIKILKIDFVGAKVGSDLKTAALLSLIITTFLIFVYIFLRFDINYAPGVVVAVVHDVIITVGIFAFLGIEFDLTIVAALLTLAGYSINDTIIVFDRIRETAQRLRGKAMVDVMDIAINSTLNRTVVTSGTTLATTLILFFVGGPVIHGFALALSIGIVVGTFSSIFVASPLVLWTEDLRNFLDKGSPKKQAAA
jgi:preprotein translocase subunit SecF